MNGATPNALADPNRGEVAGQMLADLQPEGFTEAESGSRQERKENLVAALRFREDLFDFDCRQRRLALFLLVYDRKADEVEVPVAWMKLLAFARHG